jgi:hypothetical protein
MPHTAIPRTASTLMGMAIAAPLFYLDVVRAINWALLIFSIVIEVIAFGHCLLQRADAFSAIGTLSKSMWLLLTGAGLFVTFLILLSGGILYFLGFIAITIAAIYLLDVRPALRDAVDGHGPW